MSEHLLIGTVGSNGRADRLAVERVREAAGDRVGVVVEVGRERPRPASLIAPEQAKRLEATLAEALPGAVVKARGNLVFVAADDSPDLTQDVCRLREQAEGCPLAVVATASRYRELLELGWDEVVIRSDQSEPSPGEPDERDALTELVVEEAAEFADRVELAGPGRGRGSRRLRDRLGSNRGQATPLVLGGVFALVLGAVAIVAISGAVTSRRFRRPAR